VIKQDYTADEFGKDERSLLRLPFTLLGKHGSRKKDKVIYEEWEAKYKGKVVRFFKEVTGNAKYGLPSYPAENVYMALQYLWARSEPDSQRMRIGKRSLLKLMN
jgi:hypothetical protein